MERSKALQRLKAQRAQRRKQLQQQLQRLRLELDWTDQQYVDRVEELEALYSLSGSPRRSARPLAIGPMGFRLTRNREGQPVVRRAQRSTGDSGDSDLSDDADPPAAGHRRDRPRHLGREILPAVLEALRPEGGSA